MNTRIVFPSVILLLSTQAMAGGMPEVYVGAGVGASKSNADEGNLVVNPSRCDLAGATCSNDDSSATKRLYVGHPLSDKLAVEAEYVDLGKVVDGKIIQGGVSDHYSQKTQGLGVSLVGQVKPLANNPVAVYAKVGALHWISKAEASFSPVVTGFGASVSRKENGTAPTLGIGVEYPLANKWSLRAGWDRYFNVGESDALLDEGTSTWRTLKTDVDNYHLDAVYHF